MKLDQIRVAITKEKGYTKNIFIVYLEDIEVNVKIRLTREFFFFFNCMAISVLH